jgi:hypothetical protein
LLVLLQKTLFYFTQKRKKNQSFKKKNFFSRSLSGGIKKKVFSAAKLTNFLY